MGEVFISCEESEMSHDNLFSIHMYPLANCNVYGQEERKKLESIQRGYKMIKL